MKTLTLGRGLLAACVLALSIPVAWADAVEEEGTTSEDFMQSLHFRDGHIEVPQAKAHFDLGPEFRYLDKADARRVLEDYWNNPPDDNVLGMVVPRHPALDEDGSWVVVVTYANEGYVSDADAAKIDYDQLLADMKQSAVDENDARREQGYGSVDLIGWAVPPRYDVGSKKLHWAQELRFEGQKRNTLNYDIRVLGRHGYLSLNAVASMGELEQVRAGMQQLLPMTGFDEGARYADHNPSTDKIASYGLATLIGGGLAAKAGLFAKLGLVLAKFWKLLAIGVVGLVGGVRKLLGIRKDRQGTVR